MNEQISAERGGYALRPFVCVTPAPPATSRVKRAIDLSISVAALTLLAPLMLIIAVAILVETGRPIIFRQHRTGLGGTPFRIMKFRTMKVAEDGAVIRHASPKDKRVTVVGRFLRKSHWDEFPQLINVLMGDMTLIGPRPHAVAHDLFYEKYCPQYNLRFSAKPGLTGLAQVSGYRGEIRDIQHMEQRVEADILYVDRWSLRLDFTIAMRTLPLLFVDNKSY